jgi:hypothetical protein
VSPIDQNKKGEFKMDTSKQTYSYHAHGHALGGQIERPFDQIIEVQAGMSLPTTGGYGSARAENFRFQEIVSFGAAYTQVSGSHNEESGSFTTLVSSTVERLNILDVVTADRVVARLSSEHPPAQEEPRIRLLGSHFENLRIAGCPVDVELADELFLKLDTFEAFRKEFESNAEFRKMAEDPLQTGQAQKLPERHGVIVCSLLKDLKTFCPGLKRQGYTIIVPCFGKIFLAEVRAQYSRRTLTMIRFDLNCAVCGTGVVTEVVGNGVPL